MEQLGATVGGGEVGPGPASIVSSAALQLGASRWLSDQGGVRVTPGYCWTLPDWLWAPAKGTAPVKLESEEPLVTASVSPDGQRIVTGSTDGIARYWKSTGELVFRLDDGIDPTAEAVITDAAWGHNPGYDPKRDELLDDPDLIVTGSSSGVVRLWRMQSAGEPLALGHSAAVRHASFSPDESMVVAGCDDGSARIWRIPERTFRELPRHRGAVVRAIFDHAQRRVLTASVDGIARMSAVDGLSPSLELGEGRVPIVSAEFDPDDSHVLLLFEDHRAVVYRADDPHAIVEQQDGIGLATYTAPGNWYSSPAFSNATAYAYDRQGDRVIVGFSDGKVVRASPASQQVLGDHNGPVLAIALSPSGDSVVTSAADGKAFIFPLSTPSNRTLLGAHLGAIVSASFRPPLGDRIVTASRDGVARLWSVTAGSDSVILNGSGGPLTYAALSPKGDSVLTASEANNAFVWAVDVKPALWGATRYCVPAEDRQNILAESEYDARKGFEACRGKTVRQRLVCRETTASAVGRKTPMGSRCRGQPRPAPATRRLLQPTGAR
jgi:WD40 repeat protein